jgi:hypothetical protein
VHERHHRCICPTRIALGYQGMPLTLPCPSRSAPLTGAQSSAGRQGRRLCLRLCGGESCVACRLTQPFLTQTPYLTGLPEMPDTPSSRAKYNQLPPTNIQSGHATLPSHTYTHLRGLIQQHYREGPRPLPQRRLPQQGTRGGAHHWAGGKSSLPGCLGPGLQGIKLSPVGG